MDRRIRNEAACFTIGEWGTATIRSAQIFERVKPERMSEGGGQTRLGLQMIRQAEWKPSPPVANQLTVYPFFTRFHV